MPEEPKNYWEQPSEAANEQPVMQPTSTPAEPPTEQATTPIPSAESLDDATQEATPTERLTQRQQNDEPITWTAQEYIHPEKNAIWYILFAIIVVALVAVDVFFLHSWTFSALVVVMAIALIIYIRRPARELTYALSPAQGLYVGEKLYLFDDFRSFGLIRDGEHYSIMLIPRQRFASGVSVYFPDEAGERIVDILGQRLPMEDLKLDIVDVIVRKLRM